MLWFHRIMKKKIRKKFDDFEDFLVLVLVDHFSDLPICMHTYVCTHLFDGPSSRCDG